MLPSLYSPVPDAPVCPLRETQNAQWMNDLPLDLLALVVAPVSLRVSRDSEMRAERTYGADAANAACFSEYRYVLTQLRCDDDDELYEAPVFAEALTSWRLTDARWLVCRTTIAHLDRSVAHTSLSLRDSMPRV